MTWSLTDPIVMKAAGGAALYAFGGSRLPRMAGLALLGWAAWEYLSAPQSPGLKVIPYDPDAPLPLSQAATSSGGPSGDPFVGTRWEGSTGYTPSIRPARPGETMPGNGKVLQFRPGPDTGTIAALDDDDGDSHAG